MNHRSNPAQTTCNEGSTVSHWVGLSADLRAANGQESFGPKVGFEEITIDLPKPVSVSPTVREWAVLLRSKTAQETLNFFYKAEGIVFRVVIRVIALRQNCSEVYPLPPVLNHHQVAGLLVYLREE